ncbi:unnamed protein product [Prorocentrum cordatum]|uniref:Uncharacterized protein n=1 Tax=Prorocentrum cordatum TaxID=2364126 RepID=A0ABN9R7B4_9DINO|nr:unnamed protein product [Polarella glacialis]
MPANISNLGSSTSSAKQPTYSASEGEAASYTQFSLPPMSAASQAQPEASPCLPQLFPQKHYCFPCLPKKLKPWHCCAQQSKPLLLSVLASPCPRRGQQGNRGSEGRLRVRRRRSHVRPRAAAAAALSPQHARWSQQGLSSQSYRMDKVPRGEPKVTTSLWPDSSDEARVKQRRTRRGSPEQAGDWR